VFTVGATKAFTHVAVGIILVAVCAAHNPVSNAPLANLVIPAVHVSCNGADPISEIPPKNVQTHFDNQDSILASDPEIGFELIQDHFVTIS